MPTHVAMDALRRDFTIGAIYYNVKTEQIEDPLNGIEDLERGILRTPMNLEFFRIEALRAIKTSAQYSMIISQEIQGHLINNKEELKKFFRDNPSWVVSELGKMLNQDFAPKAWKLLYDYDFIDIFISKKVLPIYEVNKDILNTKIFNVAVLSHTSYLQGLFRRRESNSSRNFIFI
jgi:tRNA nucleotidyltransferase/poly(A) polymerase